MTKSEINSDTATAWRDLEVQPAELRLDPTLVCGQAFRWKSTGPAEWTCALWGYVVDLKQTSSTVLYRSLGKLPSFGEADGDLELRLRDYFQLHVRLQQLCEQWARVDPDFKGLSQTQIGVRTLRQPVVENLFTFIASSNNNIKRITMLMEKFCTRYGQKIETEKGDFYTFPSIQTVAQDQDIEQTMQGLGFGYRAKYYAKTIEYLMRMGDPDEYLHKLRVEPLEIARGELIKLSGVGPKVADCVLLMSLDKSDAVPVDTHIWQVAQRRYVGRLADSSSNSTDMLLPPGKDEQIRQLARQLRAFKTPSTKAYELAQSLIVMLFGPYAGWAQGMLFSGDLKNGVDTAAAKPKPTKRKAQQPPAATLTESALGSATPEPRRAGLRRRPYP